MKRDLIDRISAPCWMGAHHRCSGWMVVPDHSELAHDTRDDKSIRCECETCNHAKVRSDRHHHEKAQRNAEYDIIKEVGSSNS